MRVDREAIRQYKERLKKGLLHAKSEQKSLIYRGESEDHGAVSCGLLRSFCKIQKKYGANCARIFDSSRSDLMLADEGSSYFGGGVVVGSEFEALAILQHYGAQTSLIDFSQDWRVALYFACEKAGNEDGRIVFFCQEVAERCYALKIRQPAGHQHDQAGRSVGREIDQKSILAWTPTGRFIPRDAHVMRVAGKFKAGLLGWLRSQGIHRESVYRDPHGFVSLTGDDNWQKIHVARCAVEARDLSVAEEILRKVIRQDKGLPIELKGMAFHILGRTYECDKKYEEAVRAYKGACRRLPHSENGTAPRLAAARCLTELKRNDEAYEAIESIDHLW